MGIFKELLWCFVLSFVFLSASVAEGQIPQPARIGGSVTVDGTQLTQATDTGYTFVVTKQDSTAYVPAAQDTDGLNSSNWYIIDIQIYDATTQPGGANPGDTAIIHVYKDGSELSVTSPASGQVTVGSSGSTNQVNLTVVTQREYTLTVTKAGSGTGTVTSSPAGINCGGDCSESYTKGTEVTLTATPDSGMEFTGWSGGGCGGTGTCTVTMNSDNSVIATFTTSLPRCSQCSGDPVVLQNVTFPPGTACECSATTSITLGTGVTIKNGATVIFKAPTVKIQSGFHAEEGSVVNIRQE